MLPFGPGQVTLLEWKISQVRDVLPPERIYVSTDSGRLKDIANSCGVSIHHRDPYLADGHRATFAEVITGIVKDIPYSQIAWITVTSPLHTADIYRAAFGAYQNEVLDHKRYDSLITVNLLKEYFWNQNGPLNYTADAHHPPSQLLPAVYRVTNGLYMRDRDSILKSGYFIGTNPLKFEVDKIGGVDIDTEEDYRIAKALFPIQVGAGQ